MVFVVIVDLKKGVEKMVKIIKIPKVRDIIFTLDGIGSEIK